jgi:hypothetical protein
MYERFIVLALHHAGGREIHFMLCLTELAECDMETDVKRSHNNEEKKQREKNFPLPRLPEPFKRAGITAVQQTVQYGFTGYFQHYFTQKMNEKILLMKSGIKLKQTTQRRSLLSGDFLFL